MSAPSRTGRPGQQPAAGAERGFGWADRDGRRPRHAGIGDRAAVERAAELDRHDDGAEERHDSGTTQRIGTAWRHGDENASARHGGTGSRHDARADAALDDAARAEADLVPVRHDIAVPAEGEGGALVMRARSVIAAQGTDDGLRFANMRNKSLAEVLRLARDGEDNLSQFLAYYAFKVAFFYWVTVPVLTVIEYMKWVHVRPHRFLCAYGTFFLGAGVLNRFADWLVPDGLDASSWSATTWAWIAGCAFALLVATVITYVRNR